MRHRRRGRKLGRNPSHQRALLRSLARNLILTERDTDEFEENSPKVKGRIVTTLAKAKEVRPYLERCVTIACRSLDAQRRADELATDAERLSDQWREWRSSARWYDWNQAVAPVLAARRRAMRLLGDKQAVRILFDTIAPRFEDRPGGYTRILKLATPRLGDAGPQAILEFVGEGDRDRVREESTAAPSFEDEMSVEQAAAAAEQEAAVDEVADEQAPSEASAPEETADDADEEKK